MIPKGVPGAASFTPRSCVLCLRYASRFMIYRYSRMAMSPARSHLWHPSRGISFSPTTSPNVYGPRLLSHSAPALADQKSFAPRTEGQIRNLPPQLGTELAIDMTPGDAVAAAVGDVLPAENNQVGNPAFPPEKPKEKTQRGITDDPPYPTLDYKVSEELFRAAKRAAPGSPESFWSYSLYRGPNEDGPGQKPKVHYCRSKHTTERVCQQYFMNEKVLGFDLEWVADSARHAGPRRNVSLIQIASPSRIALFHVALFANSDDFVAPSFKKIMEDAEITKVGVWIKGDATRLRTHLGIDSKGLLELSHLYRLVTYSKSGQFKDINKRLIPLATQVEQYLHLPMFKGQDVRSSDWTQPLRMDQVIYSASDAYAGVHLHAVMEYHRKQLDPCPPKPHHAELNLPIRLADGIDLDTDAEEEVSEPPPEEEADPTSPLTPAARKRQLKAYLKSVKESMADISKSITQTENILNSPPPAPKDPRIEAAARWAAAFKVENQPSDVETRHGAGYATSYELRAYHLWHTNKGLVPEDIAKILRTPPLKAMTVANYIWCAVKKEVLPVDQHWPRYPYERNEHSFSLSISLT
ncbi:exonuclease [Xylariales sp. AK1849]|nr:exonuclease [Xylariales sp. AK1849]